MSALKSASFDPRRSHPVIRWLMLGIISVAITLGAPLIRAQRLFEEDPASHLTETVKVFQAHLSGQTETRRRQPLVNPNARLQKKRAIVRIAHARSGRLHGATTPPRPPVRAPPLP